MTNIRVALFTTALVMAVLVFSLSIESKKLRYIDDVIADTKNKLEFYKGEVDRLNNELQEQNRVNTELDTKIEILEKKVETLEGNVLISRGGPRVHRVTAYDLTYASCEKYPDHPEYGITASGKVATEYHTVAAGPKVPFGTRLYIPRFQTWPNQGIFTVEDRGGAIKNGCIDIFKNDPEWVNSFGVAMLEVYTLKD